MLRLVRLQQQRQQQRHSSSLVPSSLRSISSSVSISGSSILRCNKEKDADQKKDLHGRRGGGKKNNNNIMMRTQPFSSSGRSFCQEVRPEHMVRTTIWTSHVSVTKPSPRKSVRFHSSCCHPTTTHHCRPTVVPSSSSHQQQRRYKSVFVSKHNQSMNLTATDIIENCLHNGLFPNGGVANGGSKQDYRQTPTHIILRECPFCTKPTNGAADNLFKLYIAVNSGAYHCHRCGTGGSWYDWKLKLSPGNHLGQNVDPSGYNYNADVAKLQRPKARASNSGGGGGGGDFHYQAYDHGGGGGGGVMPVQHQSQRVTPLPMPPQDLQKLVIGNLMTKTSCAAMDYLVNVRGLTTQTLIKYGVGMAEYKFANKDGAWQASECVTFPWLLKVSDLVEQERLRGATVDAEWKDKNPDTFALRRIKARSIEQKSWQRMDPAGGGWGLFGYHTIPDDATELVLTEGEYDAMAVWQGTKRAAISLPNGCRSLPVEVLPMLERFDKIYLWMDNDAAGKEGAEMFARKIGLARCLIVKPTLANCGDRVLTMEELPKDANDALRKGLNLERIVVDAKRVPHERIIHFADLRKSVLDEIMYPDKYVGSPITSLPGLTRIIQGLRRGELTVLTGPTGSGKTTYLGQMSLDLAEQGVNVLWGSFEIKNTRLMHKLLQQHAREPLPTGDPSMMGKLTAIADKFEKLPFLFMKFHGGSDVDDILDAMDYAVYVNDVEHIILDNMQFMVSLKSLPGKSSFDKFDVQDVAVEKFRKFATEKNVHVTLVVHPRKEQEHTNLSMASIYGSAKATQEADTVMILQSDGKRKFLEVKKNRFNGNLGHTPLHFDRSSCRYTETPIIEVSVKDGSKPAANTGSPHGGAAPVAKGPVPDPWKSMFS